MVRKKTKLRFYQWLRKRLRLQSAHLSVVKSTTKHTTVVTYIYTLSTLGVAFKTMKFSSHHAYIQRSQVKEKKREEKKRKEKVTGITYTMHAFGPKLVSLTWKIQWQAERERGVCVMQHYWATCQIVCLFCFRFLPQEIVDIHSWQGILDKRLNGFINAPRNTWRGIRSALCKVID